MLQRIVSRRYVFTVSGNWGDLAIYNASGRKVASGMKSVAAAEQWCDELTRTFPEKPVSIAWEPPSAARNRVTSY